MRREKHKGFTLLELLIYILFFAFISYAITSFMVRLWQMSTHSHKKQESLISLYTAHDILLHDIHGASTDQNKWKEIEQACIIWHTNLGDIGWQWEYDQLIRSEGHYHKKKKRWSKRTKNLVVKQVRAVQFVCEGESEVLCVSFSITSENTCLEGVAAPLCRRLP